MRSATKRKICRAAFVVLCILPTVGVGSAAWVVRSNYYRQYVIDSWQQCLTRQLGIRTTLQAVQRNPDGSVMFTGLRLYDAERPAPVAVIRAATARHDGANWSVELFQPEVQNGGLRWLTAQLHRRLLARGDAPSQFDVQARSLVVTGSGVPWSLADLAASFQHVSGGRELLLAFRLAVGEDHEPIRLRVVRNWQLDPPATGWELHTGTTPLPCSIFAPWFAGVAHLGTDCTMTGSVWAEHGRAGWNVQLEGVVDDVDLDQLVTAQFPHKLTGLARVTLQRLQVQNGSLHTARGTIEAAHGVISASLVRAAADALGLQTTATADAVLLARYQALGLSFQLDTQSLTVAGTTDAAGTILRGVDGQPILTASAPATGLPLALIQMLVPDSNLEVPATRETAQLIRIMPLPSIVPKDPSNAQIPYAPLRLR